MIDTVVLKIPSGQYSILDPTRMPAPVSDGKYLKRAFNPTSQEKMRYGYLPRITEYERFSHGTAKFLKIELSLPKLLFGNNYFELTEHDKQLAIELLYKKLMAMGFGITEMHIRNADLFAIHYSKNILLSNNLTCSLVINELSKIDLTQKLDLIKTNFSNGGQSLYFSSKSHQFTVYNKTKDLARGKISDSRAIENDNYVQLNLLGNIQGQKKEILRLEARVSNRKLKSLRKTLPLPSELTLDGLFTLRCYRIVLVDYYWKAIKESSSPFTTRSDRPLQLLQQLLANVSVNEALRILAFHTTSEASGIRKTREALSGYYSNESIRRLIRNAKKYLPTNDARVEIIKQLSTALATYVPITKGQLNIVFIFLRAPPNRLSSNICYLIIVIIYNV